MESERNQRTGQHRTECSPLRSPQAHDTTQRPPSVCYVPGNHGKLLGIVTAGPSNESYKNYLGNDELDEMYREAMAEALGG